MHSLSDEELVALCNTGDGDTAAAAFTTLYERHKDYVLRVAGRYVDDADAALDVLQETFSYLLRKFPPTGDGLELKARLTTLLYPVAKNTALNLGRRANRFANPGAVDPDQLPAEPAPTTDTGVVKLLDVLSAERREVVLLRFIDGMTLAEVAEALQIPLGTVKSRLHSALAQLKSAPETKKFFDS